MSGSELEMTELRDPKSFTEFIIFCEKSLDKAKCNQQAQGSEELVLEIPEKESFWRHKITAGVYQVIVVSNLSATRPHWVKTVVYKDEYQKTWSRPLSEWHERYNQM